MYSAFTHSKMRRRASDGVLGFYDVSSNNLRAFSAVKSIHYKNLRWCIDSTIYERSIDIMQKEVEKYEQLKFDFMKDFE